MLTKPHSATKTDVWQIKATKFVPVITPRGISGLYTIAFVSFPHICNFRGFRGRHKWGFLYFVK
jgi:hypothetical protein